MPVAAWVVAALIVVVLVGALVFFGRKKPAGCPTRCCLPMLTRPAFL